MAAGVAKKSLLSIISRFSQAKILVIGDIMIDEFIWGKVSRISPEAPVPIVNVAGESLRLGGAANVANNIRSLEGKVLVSGIVGKDWMGDKILQELKLLGINADGVIRKKGRPTTRKTRIIAHSQQMVRYDREDRSKVAASEKQRIVSYLKKNVSAIDAIIISDYGKGIVSGELMEDISGVALKNDKVIIVDPKTNNFSLYSRVTGVTPNLEELSKATGTEINNENNLLAAGKSLIDGMNYESVLITRGDKGMTLLKKNGEIFHVPAIAKEVYDVTGAGDTVIATLTLALATGASWKTAVLISNYAAGVVVGKIGTETLTQKELKQVMKI